MTVSEVDRNSAACQSKLHGLQSAYNGAAVGDRVTGSLKAIEVFWREDQTRVELLVMLLEKLRERQAKTPRLTAASVTAWMESFQRGGSGLHLTIPDARNLQNFLAGRTKNASVPDQLTGIATYVFSHLRHPGNVQEAHAEVVDAVKRDLAGELTSFCDFHAIDLASWDWRKQSTAQVLNAHREEKKVDVLAFQKTFISLSGLEDCQWGLEKRLFPARLGHDCRLRRFIIFRNSRNPENVARMFGHFKQPEQQYPHPVFAIWYRDDNGKRLETTNIIVGGDATVYLFGPTLPAIGLSLVALDRGAISEPCFTGLQLGSDSTGNAVASRLLFVETDLPDHEAAQIGIVERSSPLGGSGTLPTDAMLRNIVNVSRSDLKVEGRASSHAEVSRLVSERLGGSVTYGDDEPFNPADPESLPFDTALFN